MTNYESIEPDKVKNIFARSFAVNRETGEVLKCFKLPCRLCLFCGNGCDDARRKWLDQPAFDPEKDIDWEKVPVDTPVIVWNSDNCSGNCSDNCSYNRYFSGIKNGCFGTYTDGRTSWSSITGQICYWDHCKLYRPEDIEKYRKKDAENG